MEKNYDFCKRLLEVHKKDRRDASLLPEANEFFFESPTAILLPADAGEVMLTAAKDFADYLFTSMNITAYVEYERGQALPPKCVRLAVCRELGEASERRGHRLTVGENVLVEGFDECGVMEGLYHLEDLMNLREAPFLTQGTQTRRILFHPRTVMSGYGMGEYPDEYLAKLAHHGFSALMLWIYGENESWKGFQNFTDLATRAARYGFDIYIENYTPHEVYPEGEEAQRFYDKMYGELFSKFPFIKGLVILGEAVHFPSRDPRIPKDLAPGWFPCNDWCKLLAMIQNAVRKIKPDVEIILSSYNWNGQPKELRHELIASLPEGVMLQCGWEMNAEYQMGDLTNTCRDYSLRCVNPGYYFLSEAEGATKHGVKLETLANTGGKTWDFGVIPFDPAPYRWAERFEAMRKAHDESGLAALADSIHYGVHPSFISEISKWAFAEPRVDLDELIPKILAMHFGKKEIDKIDQAMKLWSEAFSHMVPSHEDQYGALRIGPAHPFYSGKSGKWDGEAPPQDKFAAAKLGPGMYESVYQYRVKGIPGAIRMPYEIKEFEQVKALLCEGLSLLESVEEKNEELLRLINMGSFMVRTVITTLHRKKYFLLDEQRRAAKSESEHRAATDAMIALLRDEQENARAAIPLVEYDSSLGFEPSLEYICDKKRIEWKLSQVEEEIRMLQA